MSCTVCLSLSPFQKMLPNIRVKTSLVRKWLYPGSIFFLLEITLTIGLYMSVDIPCDIQTEMRYPFWFINGIAYPPISLLQTFPSLSIEPGDNNLTVIVVNLDFNNTLFQCATSNRGRFVYGIPARLLIGMLIHYLLLTIEVPLASNESFFIKPMHYSWLSIARYFSYLLAMLAIPLTQSVLFFFCTIDLIRPETTGPLKNRITVNFQELEITENFVRIGWIFHGFCNPIMYIVQQYSSTGDIQDVKSTTLEQAMLPYDPSAYFRIDSSCSMGFTGTYYYNFIGRYIYHMDK